MQSKDWSLFVFISFTITHFNATMMGKNENNPLIFTHMSLFVGSFTSCWSFLPLLTQVCDFMINKTTHVLNTTWRSNRKENQMPRHNLKINKRWTLLIQNWWLYWLHMLIEGFCFDHFNIPCAVACLISINSSNPSSLLSISFY